MTVGNQVNSSAIDSLLSQLAVNLRNTCDTIRNQQTFITALGTAGLEAAGFSSEDAATVVTMMSYMNTVSEVYYGVQGQAPSGQVAADFDFDNALSGLWGGQ